ncbi:MAG: hypothetical protein QM638_13420 [Nocardioides sp.]|uniref:hypothetical protein n=1 Tax=Nocardioides sp. TaxID=35761 RepID=UPI0039E424C9
MSTPSSPSRKPWRPRPAQWVAIVAALVVVIVAGVAWFGRDEDSTASQSGATPSGSTTVTVTATPTSSPSAASSTADSTSTGPAQPTSTGAAGVTRLTMPTAKTRCLVPTAALLRKNAALAFLGTVTKVGEKSVLVDVSHWVYADGFGGTGTVRITLPTVTTESDLTFTEGGTYFVAATDDAQVMVCGYSGQRSSTLRALYRSAFR